MAQRPILWDWGYTQNDLFIRSGICTEHELKNDGHLDKFPFVRFLLYPHQMRIYDRARKFTLPSPVQFVNQYFFVVFFCCCFFSPHIPLGSTFGVSSAVAFRASCKPHKFFIRYDFPFIHSCVFFFFRAEDEAWREQNVF